MGPGKDTHGTLGPLRWKAVVGPINAPQGEVTHNDGALKRDNRQVFRQTNNGDSSNGELSDTVQCFAKLGDFCIASEDTCKDKTLHHRQATVDDSCVTVAKEIL